MRWAVAFPGARKALKEAAMGESETRLGKRVTMRSAAMIFGFALSAPGAMGGALLLAPLWAVVGVLAAPWRALPGLMRRSDPALLLFLAFFVWAQLSMLWAPRYDLSVSARMAGGVLSGLLLIAAFAYNREAADSALVRYAAIGFAFATLAFGFIEIFGKAPFARLVHPDARIDLIMRNPMKGVTVLTATLWGVAGIMWTYGARMRWLLVALVAGTAVLAFKSNMDANVVALAFGVVGFLGGLVFRQHAFRIVTLFIAGVILFSPLLFRLIVNAPLPDNLPVSWTLRIEIWRMALDQIGMHPLFGYGFGSLRDIALTFDYSGAQFRAQHTHNAALHIWFETGFVGAALISAALAALGLAGAKALEGQPAGAAAATGAIAAVTPLAFLSWAIWQQWWVATLFLVAGLAAATPRIAQSGAKSS